MRRGVELVLVLAVAIGAYLAWKTGQERSRLERTFDRLVRTAGDLEVGDPSRVHIRAIPTGEPLHFAWRVYMPANYSCSVHTKCGNSTSHSGGWRSDSYEFIARVRFREDESGALHVYAKFANGSDRMGVGGPEFASLLRGQWSKVVIEQIGADERAAVKPDEHVTLLRLSLPEELQEKARSALSANDQKQFVPVFFTLELGDPATTSNP